MFMDMYNQTFRKGKALINLQRSGAREIAQWLTSLQRIKFSSHNLCWVSHSSRGSNAFWLLWIPARKAHIHIEHACTHLIYINLFSKGENDGLERWLSWWSTREPECETQNPYKIPECPACLESQCRGDRKRKIMGAHWPASLADLMSSRLTLTISKVDGDYERHLTSTSGLLIYLSAHRTM